jgi:hypothetical protein
MSWYEKAKLYYPRNYMTFTQLKTILNNGYIEEDQFCEILSLKHSEVELKTVNEKGDITEVQYTLAMGY